MDNNKRSLIRVEVGDFLEIRPLSEVGKLYSAKSRNFTLMGLCFSSEMEWQVGQVLFIDYFIPDELDSVKLKMIVTWSEFIGPESGYFCGGEIIDIEEDKQKNFAAYYFRKMGENSF